MAKKSFKDLIFKLLRKDENLGAYGGVKQNKPKSFKVKFTDPANKKKFHITYRSKGEAEAKMAQLKRDGVKQIEIISEGERALARDKSTDQPKKYVSGLTDKQKKSHDRHLEKQGKKSDSDKSAYKQSPADKVAKTKPSKHTNKFKQMYGEDYLNEKIAGLEKKAKKSGMPYSILKKVYDRGMAAWKGGHRPGTTPQQWAFARVNSFTTKSSGTWGKADKDLAKQVRGS